MPLQGQLHFDIGPPRRHSSLVHELCSLFTSVGELTALSMLDGDSCLYYLVSTVGAFPFRTGFVPLLTHVSGAAFIAAGNLAAFSATSSNATRAWLGVLPNSS